MSYIDGYLIPVPEQNKQAYERMAEEGAMVFLDHGAIRVVESWGDDIQKGKTNDMRTAVLAEENEQVVFSWVEWPSKAVRDAGMEKVMADPRMQPEGEMPFSGARLIFGGFSTLLDAKA